MSASRNISSESAPAAVVVGDAVGVSESQKSALETYSELMDETTVSEGVIVDLSIAENAANSANAGTSAEAVQGEAQSHGQEEDPRRWYVAMVNHNSEKQVAERLMQQGVAESYVAYQTEVRRWKNGRKARVDRIVIPCVVFVRCTERERREIVALPYINRFMTNKAATAPDGLSRPLAVIPDTQIRRLQFMLGQSDIPVEITDRPYRRGDRVRVVRGGLKGLEGEVVGHNATQSELTVSLDCLGYARLTIDTINLEHITPTRP